MSGQSKALFLDRDGVINKERGYITRLTDFEFKQEIFDICRHFVAKGYQLIVITNQGGIAQKLYDIQFLELLHQKMIEMFIKEACPLLDIFYCPHHPKIGKCLCRKPESLLFEKACALHNIAPNQSIMIGDRYRDLKPAQKLGMKTILIGEDSDDTCIITPELQVPNLKSYLEIL